MKIIIYPNIPNQLIKSSFSYMSLLNKLMAKMTEREVAQIPKSFWTIKTSPGRMYGSYHQSKNPEFIFSQRQDKEYFYLQKVKAPIAFQDQEGRWHNKDVWQNQSINYEIIKKELAR